MRKGLSIRNKFIFVTLLIMVVLVSFGLFLINLIRDLATVTENIIDHPLEVSNSAYYANIEVLRMHRDLKEILLVEEEYELNILVDKIRVSENKVYIALDVISYDILGEEGKQLQRDARKLFDDWKIIRSEIIDAVRENRLDEALEITRNRGADHITALERKLVELNQYARKKAEGFHEEAIQIESNTERTAAAGILFVMLFVVLGILLMSWNVLGGIKSLRVSLQEIMTSGEFQSVSLSGSDELTELSMIFNDLVANLADQLWVKEGNKHMNMLLSNPDDFFDTISEYTKEFAEYGDYLSVVYYHKVDEKLILKGKYNKLSFMDDFYVLGEKFVGECAVSGLSREILYEDITFVETLPYREILVEPISFNEETFGVMCIVLNRFRLDNDNEFISECLRDFSAFVSTSVQRSQIDRLFVESINANKELTSKQVRLEENQEELQAANITLQEQRDLLNVKSKELLYQNRELVNLREELVKKYQDLEEVTKYRSQFLTNISHELRTPLNSIVVLSNMLVNKRLEDLDASDEEKMGVISKAADELLVIINDILDLSKVESGNVELYEDVFAPSDLLLEWQTIYEPLISDKGLEAYFVNDIDSNLYGDKGKISHIVTNFISNAIKFTHYGHVQVKITENDEPDYPVRIEVEDTGIGIDEEDYEDIFKEFVQSDGSISRIYGGTGLGLAICKNYSNLIGGKIDLKSSSGKGSTFALLLAKTCLVTDSVQIKDIPQKQKPHVTLDEGLMGKKIMICDDEPMNVFALSAMIEDLGLRPVAALTLEEAVEAFDNNPDISAILMDYMMPIHDGFTTLEKLKNKESWSAIPVAIITAADLDDKQLTYLTDKNYSLIRKPIDYDVIVTYLNENLS